MWGNGGDWESAPGKFTVNSEQNVDTLKVLNCLTNVYKVTEPNPGQTNRTDGVFRPFADGEVGMMSGASFAPSIFKGWDSTVDYGVAPLPVNGDVEPFTLGVQDYLMSFKNPGNKTAVSKFLNFFYEPDNYVEFLTSQGFLPATAERIDGAGVEPRLRAVPLPPADGTVLPVDRPEVPGGAGRGAEPDRHRRRRGSRLPGDPRCASTQQATRGDPPGPDVPTPDREASRQADDESETSDMATSISAAAPVRRRATNPPEADSAASSARPRGRHPR